MYPATLIILSEESDGLFYKVTEVPHCTHKREKLNLMSLNPPFGRKEKDSSLQVSRLCTFCVQNVLTRVIFPED